MGTEDMGTHNLILKQSFASYSMNVISLIALEKLSR